MLKLVLLAVVILIGPGVSYASAQGGGKAEPKRVSIAPGRTSVTISGTLSNGQEMDHVFGARKGQKVTIKNASPGLFDFRIFRDESDFETEFDSSPSLTIEIPETGDYLLFVRKKQVRKPSRAKFSLTITIK
jgi:hypothetical protein